MTDKDAMERRTLDGIISCSGYASTYSFTPMAPKRITMAEINAAMLSVFNSRTVSVELGTGGYSAGVKNEPLSANPHQIGTDEHRLWTKEHIQGSKVRHAVAGTYGISDEERARVRAENRRNEDPTAILDDPPLVFPGEEPPKLDARPAPDWGSLTATGITFTFGGKDLSNFVKSVNIT